MMEIDNMGKALGWSGGVVKRRKKWPVQELFT